MFHREHGGIGAEHLALRARVAAVRAQRLHHHAVVPERRERRGRAVGQQPRVRGISQRIEPERGTLQLAREREIHRRCAGVAGEGRKDVMAHQGRHDEDEPPSGRQRVPAA